MCIYIYIYMHIYIYILCVWVWLCVYVSMCTCICVYRCIYYVCERVFIKLFYLKFFKGKNAFEIWESMGPWLGVVQWAEVILHWQGPKSNDLCISWIFPRWNPHDCPNTAGDGEKQIAGDELNEVTKGGNRLSKGRGFVGHNLIQLSPYRPLWEGLIVKMLEGGVHNSFEHESRASNLHGPLKARLFADLS